MRIDGMFRLLATVGIGRAKGYGRKTSTAGRTESSALGIGWMGGEDGVADNRQ